MHRMRSLILHIVENKSDLILQAGIIFELGFFMGALGRERVCCIYKKDVELPSDIHGLVCLPYVQSIRECNTDISRN
jgi:predicted nucleotide-binding protein